MNTAQRSFFRIAAVVALSVASACASAQSSEYRRGYDDGYEAGLRAAGGDERGPRGGWGGLFVEEAEYGVRGAMCNARRGVMRDLERNHGVVNVNNELCGDPARSQQKRLRVVYRCGDSEPVRVFAQEGERLRLSCRR